MLRTSRFQAASFAVALALDVILASAGAPAAIDTVVAARITVASQPMSDCSAKARGALMAVMQNAVEAGDGSGHWLGFGRITPGADPSAAAVVECHADNSGGYAASFTCSAEVPPNPDTATTLCQKLTTAFSGGGK